MARARVNKALLYDEPPSFHLVRDDEALLDIMMRQHTPSRLVWEPAVAALKVTILSTLVRAAHCVIPLASACRFVRISVRR